MALAKESMDCRQAAVNFTENPENIEVFSKKRSDAY